MATSHEYSLVAAKLAVELTADESKFVPAAFKGMIPQDAIPHLATACAHVAIDTLDASRSVMETGAGSVGPRTPLAAQIQKGMAVT